MCTLIFMVCQESFIYTYDIFGILDLFQAPSLVKNNLLTNLKREIRLHFFIKQLYYKKEQLLKK